jgi:hypothetical protein
MTIEKGQLRSDLTAINVTFEAKDEKWDLFLLKKMCDRCIKSVKMTNLRQNSIG